MQDFMYMVLWETMKWIKSLGGVSVSLFLFPSILYGIQITQEVKIPFQLFSQILNKFGSSYEVISHLVTTHECVRKCNRFQSSG